MRHQDYADAIVDPAAPAPEDLAEHLASCAECAALAGAHRAATALAGAELPARRSPRPSKVLARGALAASALLGLVAALAVLGRGPGPAPAQAPAHAGREVQAAGPADSGLSAQEGWSDERAWQALASLSSEVSGYARAGAAGSDAALTGFRAEPYFALGRSSFSPKSNTEESP